MARAVNHPSAGPRLTTAPAPVASTMAASIADASNVVNLTSVTAAPQVQRG
jgi:hypothetical protein